MLNFNSILAAFCSVLVVLGFASTANAQTSSQETGGDVDGTPVTPCDSDLATCQKEREEARRERETCKTDLEQCRAAAAPAVTAPAPKATVFKLICDEQTGAKKIVDKGIERCECSDPSKTLVVGSIDGKGKTMKCVVPDLGEVLGRLTRLETLIRGGKVDPKSPQVQDAQISLIELRDRLLRHEQVTTDNFKTVFDKMTDLESRVADLEGRVEQLEKVQRRVVNIFGGVGLGVVVRPIGPGMQVQGNLTVTAPIASSPVEVAAYGEIGGFSSASTGRVFAGGGGLGVAFAVAKAHRLMITGGVTQFVAGAPTETIDDNTLNGNGRGYAGEARAAYIGCVGNIVCINPYVAVGGGHASGWVDGKPTDKTGPQVRAGVNALVWAY